MWNPPDEEMLEWIGRIRESSESLLNALPLDASSSSASSYPLMAAPSGGDGDAGPPALDTPVNRCAPPLKSPSPRPTLLRVRVRVRVLVLVDLNFARV
jgi:hypothetical protein